MIFALVGVAIFDSDVSVVELSFGLPHHSTVFEAELIVIIKALEECNSKYDRFLLFSDSKANSLDPLFAKSRIHGR